MLSFPLLFFFYSSNGEAGVVPFLVTVQAGTFWIEVVISAEPWALGLLHHIDLAATRRHQMKAAAATIGDKRVAAWA